MARSYDNSNRARKAAQTAERIAATTEALIAERPLSEVTLNAIAEGSGVTVQTVLRHMGSRDGCFEAVKERVERRVQTQRLQGEPGDIEGAIASLVAHYEAEGQLVLGLLAQEGLGEALADEGAQEGRRFHRAWVEHYFEVSEPEIVDALVAATDLYVWKLLRLDLGRSVEATRSTLVRLVRAVLESS